MDGVRRIVELGYPLYRFLLLRKVKKDPERAHEEFIDFARYCEFESMTDTYLGTETSELPSTVRFANAAGMNKNGEIPPAFLYRWGWTVNTVGTVCYDPWHGNLYDEQTQTHGERMWYFKPQSLVNKLGLPGYGAKAVRDILARYHDPIPARISLMATPTPNGPKKGQEAIDDMLGSMHELHRFARAGYEINVSCPNTHGNLLTGENYEESLDGMLRQVVPAAGGRDVFVKLSPDITLEGIHSTLAVCKPYGERVTGFTGFNTTTERETNGVPKQWTGRDGKTHDGGGASGDAVWDLSREKQRLLVQEIEANYKDMHWQINACGGIGSVERMNTRIEEGHGRVKEIQGYTHHTYQGPRLLRQMRLAA